MDRTPKSGEIYRHFKNKLYKIVGIATHSETREKLVIYEALYGTFEIYARPLEMFISEVDHVKYPEVKQKYRFEHVVVSILDDGTTQVISAEAETSANSASMSEVDSVAVQSAPVAEQPAPAEGEVPMNEEMAKLMEFLDADTFDEKYNVLISMRDTITDKLIDDIAVAMDVVIPEGPLTKRYDSLKNAIRTRQHYEFSNRLR